MSKTFTSRPSVAQSRGRGNPSRQTQTDSNGLNRTRAGNSRIPPGGRGGNLKTSSSNKVDTRVPNTSTSKTGMENRDVSPQRKQEDIGQRMSHQGSFTMITPNERRRQEISNQARREEEKYNAYKEKNRLTHVSYVGTAGGGEISHDGARQKLVQNHKTSQLNAQQKQQQWRDEKKRREETIFQQKKDVQRQKAVKNEQLTVHQQIDQKKKWDEDRRRKNEEFLKRFEKKSTNTVRAENFGDCSNGAEGYSDTRNRTENNSTQKNISVPSSTRSFSAAEENIQMLQAMFPDYDTEILRDILRQTNNSVEEASLLLQT